MYAIASFNDAKFQPLADVTDNVKRKYCEKNGYAYHVRTDVKFTPDIGFEKIVMVLDLFEQHPEYEWVLFCECDAMVTNFDIKIEDRIDDRYHFIVATDVNEINAGVFLARNSEQGRAYLKFILEQRPKYQGNWQAEQAVIQDSYEDWKDTVLIVPQRVMNSFEYQYYQNYPKPVFDIMGNFGTWEPGDWICHWPGLSSVQEFRIQLAQQMAKRVLA